MADLIRAFDNGRLKYSMVFVELFGTIPNEYDYSTNKVKYDIPKLFDSLKEKESNSFRIVNHTSIKDVTTSMIDKRYEDECTEWNCDVNRATNAWEYLYTIDYEKKEICRYDDTSITLYSNSHVDFKEWLKPILSEMPLKEEPPREAVIDMVAYDHGYYTISSKIRSTQFEMDNYNDDFQSVINETKKFLNQRESGLIVWHGIKGSGKTTAIRALISSTDKKYILVTNTIAAHLAEPDFISFMHEHKDSIFILEDCEQILMAREENRFGGAVANILNMSDGLMSDIFNVKFICTFNTDISKIDDALLRPGRCYGKYEFKELSKEKTKLLLKKNGFVVDNPEPMVLADIYNYTPKTEVKTKKKIGF